MSALKRFAVVLLAWVAASSASPAAVLISWVQDGADVVATYAGTLGVDATTNSSTSVSSATIDATLFVLFNAGPYSYTGGLSAINSTLGFFADPPAWGDNFGYLNDGSLVGPAGFTADTYVTGTLRLENKTLAEIGAVFPTDLVVLRTTGGTPLVTYTNAIPEPGTAMLVGLALVAGGFLSRRRHLANH